MTGEYKKIEEIEINGRKRNLYKNKGSNAKFIKCKGKYMKYSDFIRMNKPKSKYNKGGGMFDFFGKKE